MQLKDADTVGYPKGVELTGSTKQRLADVGPLTQKVLETILNGNFRGAGGKKASNMFRKGSDLVMSHHVLALRLGTDRTRSTVLIGGVVIATYRRGCYHVCAEYQASTQTLKASYCTCFAGNAKCIHLAAVMFALARYQRQPIADFDGEKPICFSGGDTIAQFSRDTIMDTLSWVEACRFLANHPPHVLVHNLALEQKTYAELRALCDLIRRWRVSKKGKRGPQAFGASLEKMSVAKLRSFAEGKGIDLDELAGDADADGDRGVGSKKWLRKAILLSLAERDDGDDPDCAAAADQLELDVCPCDAERRGTVDGEVECPSCRQWWHYDCTGLASLQEAKKFKKCKTCEEFGAKVKRLRDGNKFGLFQNDWADLHK